MPDRIKNLLIGIFVFTAIGVIICMLLFIHPYIGDEAQNIRVLFADIDKVNVGTRVLFAGKPVGEVTVINEVPDAIIYRAQHGGDIYPYELILAIDSSIKVYTTDKIVLRTAGLLGERSVAIDPVPLKPGQKLKLVTKNEIMYSEKVGTVEDTFKEFKDVAARLDLLLDKIHSAFVTLDEKKAWENIGDAIDNMNQIIANVKEGKGTAGKIFSNDELYLNTMALLGKGETILDDINHYGILFQNDKGWQRLRARRMNLLEKLSTPQEFRNYFNDEINQIQTSLARVSMVMDKSAQCNLIEDKEFTKVYIELMRRVTALEEEIRMYNTQLVNGE